MAPNSFCTWHAVQGRITFDEMVATRIKSTSSGETPAFSSARRPACTAMDTVVSSVMMCRLATPVRSCIHSSLVSTSLAISLLSIIYDGVHAPVP